MNHQASSLKVLQSRSPTDRRVAPRRARFRAAAPLWRDRRQAPRRSQALPLARPTTRRPAQATLELGSLHSHREADLWQLSRQRVAAAREELAYRYRQLVEAVGNRLPCWAKFEAEREEVGKLALHEAVAHFDGDPDYFAAFADRVVANRMSEFLTDARALAVGDYYPCADDDDDEEDLDDDEDFDDDH